MKQIKMASTILAVMLVGTVPTYAADAPPSSDSCNQAIDQALLIFEGFEDTVPPEVAGPELLRVYEACRTSPTHLANSSSPDITEQAGSVVQTATDRLDKTSARKCAGTVYGLSIQSWKDTVWLRGREITVPVGPGKGVVEEITVRSDGTVKSGTGVLTSNMDYLVAAGGWTAWEWNFIPMGFTNTAATAVCKGDTLKRLSINIEGTPLGLPTDTIFKISAKATLTAATAAVDTATIS